MHTPSPLRPLLLILVAVSAGCGDDEGLRASGYVHVDVDGTPTGFEFAEEAQLVDLALDEAPGGLIAGECILGGSGTTVVVQAPGSAPEGVGIHRLEAHFADDPSMRIAVQLGSETYEGVDAGDCTGTAVREEDEFELAVSCTVASASGATAQIEAVLEVEGCQVNY